jgi:hypothetical protein
MGDWDRTQTRSEERGMADGPSKEVLTALGQALTDQSVRSKISDDPKATLREAGVDVDQLPDRAIDALGSAKPEELHELGQACAAVAKFSDRAGLATNEFL